LHADFAHDGADLVIAGADGSKVVVIDYFRDGVPDDLMTVDGHKLPGDLVEALAGPVAPGQYAQGDAGGADIEIGQVSGFSGDVTATGADGLKVPLGAGSSVYQGDVLETSGDGAVNIVFVDGTTFSLGADAKMVLDELIYDASSQSGSSIMSVVTGTFVFITGEVAGSGPDAMQVRTPSGTIGIRGTKVGCNLDVGGGQSVCVLLPDEGGKVGEFVFANESGSQHVTQAFEAVVANAFNAPPMLSTVLPDHVPVLLSGVLPGVLTTEAQPGVLSGGSTFQEFVSSQGSAARGLEKSGVLSDQELMSLLTGGSAIENEGKSLAVLASLFIAEVSAGGPGSASSGNLNIASGGLPAQSIELTGFSITANGSAFTLTSEGVPVVVTQTGNTVEGFADGELVFRFVLDSESENFTFFLFQPLDHQDTTATGSGDTIEVTFTIAVTFIDGTTDTTAVQAVILDAGPTATTTSNAVDEANDLGTLVAGNLAILPGADGLQSLEVTGITATADGNEVPLTSDGKAILFESSTADGITTVTGFADTNENGVIDGTDVQIFTLTFDPSDPSNAAYTFTLDGPIDHTSGGKDTLTLTLNVAVTDGDGDTVTSTIVIDVTDDVVIAADDDGDVTEGTAAALTGNVVTNDDLGNDGLGGVTQFVHDGVVYTPESNGGAVQSNDGTTIVITTVLDGSFTFNFETGAYSYVAPDTVDNTGGDPIETFVYTVADGDGDTSTATLTITVNDANQPTAHEDSLVVDEAAGDTDPSNPVNPFTPILAVGDLTANDEPGGDGFGPIRITDVTYDGGLGAAAKVDDGSTITFTGDGWTLVFDKATGEYTYTQTAALSHGAGDLIGEFSYTLQDVDGSTSESKLKLTVTDDVIVAVDDNGGTIDEGSAGSLTGNVLANDDPGADGFGNVTQVSFTTTDAAAAAAYIGLAGITVTEDTSTGVFTITATLIGGQASFTTLLGGELIFFGDGSYTYTPPPEGSLREDGVETFTYTVFDSDGDSDTATLTIAVNDIIEPAGVFLSTNTNVDDQVLRVIVTTDDAEVLASTDTVRSGTGQETAIPLGEEGVRFEETESYAVILKFESGSGNTNVTDFDLIFDVTAENPDDPDNVFQTLLDQGNIQLGDQGSSADGVIWQIDGDGTDFTISPAILYDVDVDAALGDLVVFDSDTSNTSFSLDFGLLPTTGNAEPADALFGDIEAIDITGSQTGEVNTLSLDAQDVIDVTGVDNVLIVLGDNDSLILKDPDNWLDGDISTAEIDPVGTQTVDGEIYDVYAISLDGVMGSLLVDQDLTVQFETAGV
jgi:T1SS-143 domain-containing protein